MKLTLQTSGLIKKREILGFLLGGSSAVFVDFTTYYLLLKVGQSICLSKSFSYILGASVGFVINKYLAFESKKFSFQEIVRYVTLYALSAIANTWVNSIVLLVVSWKMFAFLCATGVSTITNFIGQKYLVFRKKEI